MILLDNFSSEEMQRSCKSARSGEQKPVRIQRRIKAKIFCLSLALENPHQALDAHMSFATATARKISCSESSHNPCLRRTRSAYRVCAQAAMMLCTCNAADRRYHYVQHRPANYLSRPSLVLYRSTCTVSLRLPFDAITELRFI